MLGGGMLRFGSGGGGQVRMATCGGCGREMRAGNLARYQGGVPSVGPRRGANP